MSFSRIALLFVSLAACTSTRLDEPAAVRHDVIPLAPLFSPLVAYSASEDGTSSSWSSLLWLVGQSKERETRTTRVLPFWWSQVDPPYTETTVLFPLYYSRDSQTERRRFYSLLYGTVESDASRTDWVLAPFFYWTRSKTLDVGESALFPLYHWNYHESAHNFTLLPLLGLAHLYKAEWGLPAEGERVGALGRSSSRRIELVNLLGIISLFGYDDVGDTREFRLATLFSNEMLSPIRSWRGRGDNPWVREWVFPLYMNVQDDDGGWMYLGPLWGTSDDRIDETHTDWWLLGLVSRREQPEGVSWSVLGFTVSGP
jgi:hypothetical protein